MNAFNPKALIDKIGALPAERIAEIEDFVAFVGDQERKRALVRAATAVSAPAFASAWNNPEDDGYDAL